MKKRLLALVGSTLGLLLGCSKEQHPAPQPTPPAGPHLTVVRGDQQTATYSEWLPDSVVLQVTPGASSPTGQRYVLTYQLRVGNGTVAAARPGGASPANQVLVDGKNRARVRWSLGCNTQQQQLTFYLFAADCPSGAACLPLDSVRVRATAQRPSGWSRACGADAAAGTTAPSFCHCAGTLYTLLDGAAYASTDEGVNWHALAAPVANDRISLLRCNGQGTLYAVLETSGVYTSPDQGARWTALNNGLLDHRYPTDLVVEDKAIFVSFMFDGLYRTTDNGGFWRKLLIDGKYYEEYSQLTRHPNGDLYLFNKWGVLFKSLDNGNNWRKQVTSYSYITTPIYDMAVDNGGNLVVASGYDGNVAVLTPPTLTGSVTNFYSPQTHTTCYVDQLTPFQDALYFLVRGNSLPGVYAGTPGNYILASASFDKPISGFYVRADKSLLLASPAGLYYFAK